MTPEERREALEAVAAEVRTCTRCPLHAQRTKAVPGNGNPETEVVFVGEGPGFNEDREGLPFVGAAGNLLNELLAAIGWRRQDVFVTNVVKCRPPGNRDPEPAEIAACAPFLRRQLEVLDPALIVTLGRHSLQTFMPGTRIGGSHGTMRPVDPATGAPNALAYAMYHPAAALRQGALKQTMLADMAGVPEALLRARERRAQATDEPTPTTAEQPATTKADEPTTAQAPDEPATAQAPDEPTTAQAPDEPTTAQAPDKTTPTRATMPSATQPPEPLPVAAATVGDRDDQMELF